MRIDLIEINASRSRQFNIQDDTLLIEEGEQFYPSDQYDSINHIT